MKQHKTDDFLYRSRFSGPKAALLGVMAFFCAFTTPAPEARAQDVPSIVVGIAPLKYLVSGIAGDRVMISVVLPNGGDPHTYEPSAIQMGIISDADAYFSIRQPFEEVLLPKFKDAAPQMTIVDISAQVERLPPPDILEIIPDPPPSPPPANATMLGGVNGFSDNAAAPEESAEPEAEEGAATEPASEEGHAAASQGEGHDGEGHGGATPETAKVAEQDADAAHGHDNTLPDPHIWLSPANMKIMAKAVLEQLTTMLPAQGQEFSANYDKFIASVDALDAAIRKLLDPLPAGQRAFLSFHPSWGYFARDYQLTQIAVELEGYEPSPQLFAKIIDEAKARHVRSILLEQQFSTALVRTLAEELKASVVAISSLSLAWSDNLLNLAKVLAAPPEIPEDFYKNIDALNAQRNSTAQGSPQ